MSVAEALFRPFESDGLSLPNRVVMAPMTRRRSPSGIPTSQVADYYARRAAENVGLVITEGVAINRPGAVDSSDIPSFFGEALASWREVAAQVHKAGAKIFPQLWHVGATESRAAHWVENDPRIESPSGLNAPEAPLGRVMSESDIADTIAAFAQAARDAQTIGFDGVEIHGAHGYLIDQFFWAKTNVRADAYGGESLAARTRFAVEVVKAIREAVGQDFPVSFRFSQFKQQDYSAVLANTPDELSTLLEPLADAGVSIFHGSQRRFWEPVFEGSDLNLAGWAKRLTGRTSIAVGSVGLSGEFASNWSGEVSQPTSIDKLLERLDAREFDLIAVGRALLNDPQWATKIAANRASELKPFQISSLETYY
ncbi:NADH:flavin oxidoreductase [Cupriavidus taiwanensis]|uniref:NADH:flavin oxidoreductase n=1 Tax=Cupriavidus taiwanensis TaxID=164546 RepID=UPI000E17408E|nr:NADH:flavin oxidoreductase [Cupriavidus taiwanensis]SOZ29608.1 NADH:flavin oxidoreductase/NADH oxidase [Cupriavidus taiwanensis]SPA34443.1 NADH:flavin oxidoreductase/NADH oxidase [Cupriavidus taiwanensis]